VESSSQIFIFAQLPAEPSRIQHMRQFVTEFLCLAFFERFNSPSCANVGFQLALEGIPTKINRALIPAGFIQTFRISPTLAGCSLENGRPNNSRPDSSTHASLRKQSLERGTGFEPATIALEERDSTVELPPPCLPNQTTSGAWDRD
jgi:hypothetical protein